MVLKEDELICDKCGGRGSIKDDFYGASICPKCQGYGKVDWIENIVGKKFIPFYGTSSGHVGIGTTVPARKLNIVV